MTTYRFTVYDEEQNTISSTWNIHIRGSDVYIFARSLAYALKTSLHTATGQCHLKYTPDFAESNEGVVPDPYIDKWTYDKSQHKAFPFRIIIPYESVNRPYEPFPAKKQMDLIAAPSSGHSVFVCMAILGPNVEVKGEGRLLHILPNGGKLVVKELYDKTQDINLPKSMQVNLYKGQTPEDLENMQQMRMLLLAGEGGERAVHDLVFNRS